MFLSNNPALIFVHVPKTGGMSMFNALCQAVRLSDGDSIAGRKTLLLTPNRYTHMSYEAILLRNPQATRHFSFGFVRNPWDRWISFYMRANSMFNLDDFKRVVRTSAFMRVPQRDFLFSHRHNKQVDFIGRFENLKVDFNKACAMAGIHATLDHLNYSHRARSYRYYYDKESRDLVAAASAQDIERFGYEF